MGHCASGGGARPLCGLANCINYMHLKPLHLTSDVEWADMLSTALNTALNNARATVQTMNPTGGGSVQTRCAGLCPQARPA